MEFNVLGAQNRQPNAPLVVGIYGTPSNGKVDTTFLMLSNNPMSFNSLINEYINANQGAAAIQTLEYNNEDAFVKQTNEADGESIAATENPFNGLVEQMEELYSQYNQEEVQQQDQWQWQDLSPESTNPYQGLVDMVQQEYDEMNAALAAANASSGSDASGSVGSTGSTGSAATPAKVSSTEMHRDIAVLGKTTSRWGTDEDAIATILAKYAATGQLDELAKEFKTLRAKDLTKELCDETTGSADKMIRVMLGEDVKGIDMSKTYDVNDPTQLGQAAQTLHNALYRCGTDENALIKILGNPNYTAEDIAKIVNEYNAMFAEVDGKTLQEKIGKDTSGFFEKLLLARIGA